MIDVRSAEGCSEDKSCKDWKFTFPSIIDALKGSCVEIPCTFTHPEDAKDFNFFWYSKWNQAKIFNNKTPSDVADEYKGRTFLTGNTGNDCSIKINNVEKTESYYPGINIDINSNTLKNRHVFVYVADRPPEPLISGTENLEDKKTVNISCAVNHTCPSHPPTLTWNITGNPIMENHEDLHFQGSRRMETRMTYTASYTDDKTVLQCAATFPNNKTSVKIMTLNIKYRPRSVIISVDNTQEGDDVMLLCSSQANPPVNNYTWYGIGEGGKLSHGHGDKISVKNTTTEKYICAATNDMGTEASSVIEFTNQSGNERRILYAGIGTGVGLVLIIVLIVLFCIYRRKIKTSVLKERNVEKTQQPSDTTYTALRKSEKEDEYATLQPSDTTYTALRKRETEDEYSTL
ncbi:LOW QUALITY PROTEIN: B-cell receptor CD22-like [Lithobates pipiens]